VLEGRSYREAARAHGVPKSWFGKLVGRYRSGGYAPVEPRSRTARRIPHRTPNELEDLIAALRTELSEAGFDAGAETIHHHLGSRHRRVPLVSTMWAGVAPTRPRHSPAPQATPQFVDPLRGAASGRRRPDGRPRPFLGAGWRDPEDQSGDGSGVGRSRESNVGEGDGVIAMTDVRERLRRVSERLTPLDRAFERLLEREARKRRCGRVAAATVALVVASP
jgi:hypothetical protein